MHCKGVHFKDINIFAASINLTVIPIINILQFNFLRLCRFNFTVIFYMPNSRHRYRKVGIGTERSAQVPKGWHRSESTLEKISG